VVLKDVNKDDKNYNLWCEDENQYARKILSNTRDAKKGKNENNYNYIIDFQQLFCPLLSFVD
jgi:hypothetical protein